jgi:hypothetical protein
MRANEYAAVSRSSSDVSGILYRPTEPDDNSGTSGYLKTESGVNPISTRTSEPSERDAVWAPAFGRDDKV